jgi:hypothetical protein
MKHRVLQHDVVVEAIEHRTLQAMDSLGDDTNGDGERLEGRYPQRGSMNGLGKQVAI